MWKLWVFEAVDGAGRRVARTHFNCPMYSIGPSAYWAVIDDNEKQHYGHARTGYTAGKQCTGKAGVHAERVLKECVSILPEDQTLESCQRTIELLRGKKDCRLRDELIELLKKMVHPIRVPTFGDRQVFLRDVQQAMFGNGEVNANRMSKLEESLRKKARACATRVYAHLLTAIAAHYGSVEISRWHSSCLPDQDVNLFNVSSITTRDSDGQVRVNTLLSEMGTTVNIKSMEWTTSCTIRGLRAYSNKLFYGFDGVDEESRCTHFVEHEPECIIELTSHLMGMHNRCPPFFVQLCATAIAGFFCPLPKDVFRIVIGY